jgi:hypothetical protein
MNREEGRERAGDTESGDHFNEEGFYLNPIEKKTIVLVLIIGSIIGFLIFIYLWVARPFDARTSSHLGDRFNSCAFALEDTDEAIAYYEKVNGIYPSSIEELVDSGYIYSLDELNKRVGCTYSLDTSTTPPVARCSIHGTWDTFEADLIHREQNRHRIKFVIITTIFILCLALGIYLGVRWRIIQ